MSLELLLLSAVLGSVAASGGAILGSIAHEATHAVAAVAVGELVAVGWQGGLAGGPYVDFRASARWRSEVIRKAPLLLGAFSAVGLVVTYRGPSLPWLAGAGVVLGILKTSPEDLSRERAAASAAD